MNKNIQCTFRLPPDVVDLINSQKGRTRTERLMNLIDSITQTERIDLDQTLRGIGEALKELVRLQSANNQKNDE